GGDLRDAPDPAAGQRPAEDRDVSHHPADPLMATAVDSRASAWQGARQSATPKGANGKALDDCGPRRRDAGALDHDLMQAASTERQATVKLLGGFEFRRGDEAVPLPLSVQRVVAFLALHEGPLQRVHVAGALWIDSTEEHANARLRTGLWPGQQVRPTLVSRTSTHLALGDDIPVDAGEIASLAQRILGGAPADVEDISRLAATRELLPDWYDDWVIIERERLRQLCLHALEQVSTDATADGRYAQATEAGLGAVALEPLRESAHRVVIEAYLAEGN